MSPGIRIFRHMEHRTQYHLYSLRVEIASIEEAQDLAIVLETGPKRSIKCKQVPFALCGHCLTSL